MAVASIPVPGSRLGPCDRACVHRDCVESRGMAAKVCWICDQPIGFAAPFYDEGAAGLVHAKCFEAAGDQESQSY